MTDKRDICERLEDHSIDGAIFLRLNAAKEIRALRHYVARLEGDLAREEYQHAKARAELEKAREHISDQAIDIVTLGQEVGRLREALQDIFDYECRTSSTSLIACTARSALWPRAALAEKEEK